MKCGKSMGVGLAAILVAVTAQVTPTPAEATSVTVLINNKTKKNIKDLVLEFNDDVTNVVDNNGFTTPAEGNPNKNSGTIKFDGGNIAPGSKDSIIVEVKGTKKNHKVLKWSFTDGTTRTNSKGDDINGKSVAGGASGASFLGVDIAPGTFGYFYQFDRNPLFASSPARFELRLSTAPLNFGVISNTFDPQLINDEFAGLVDEGEELDGVDGMVPDNLTGDAGIAPIDWSYDPSIEAMVAEYGTDAFQIGDAASLLWFTHPDAPQLGGNAFASQNVLLRAADGTVTFTNSIDAPKVPLPASLPLLAAGLAGLAALRTRRKT